MLCVLQDKWCCYIGLTVLHKKVSYPLYIGLTVICYMRATGRVVLLPAATALEHDLLDQLRLHRLPPPLLQPPGSIFSFAIFTFTFIFIARLYTHTLSCNIM